MVAERDRVDVEPEELVGLLGRDADPAGGVLAVDHDEVRRELLAQPGQQLAQDPATRPPDHVADEEDGRDARAYWQWMTRHTEEEAANPLDDVGEAGPESPPLKQPTPAPPANVAPVLVPRWVQMVLLPVAIAGAYLLLQTAGRVLLLFIIAGLIALLLNPFVALLQKLRIPRGAAVGIVMVAMVSLLVGLGFLLANPIADQVSSFQSDVPGYVDDANRELADLQDWLDRNGIDLQVKQEGETALQTIGESITGGAGEVVNFTREAVQILVEASLALILVIVVSIYMMIYGDRIGAVARSVMPPGDGTPDDDYPTRDPGLAVRLRARAGPVQPDHGHQRGADAVRARLARDLPGRQDVRDRVRGLVRLRGADPVRRARRSAASRRW